MAVSRHVGLKFREKYILEVERLVQGEADVLIGEVDAILIEVDIALQEVSIIVGELEAVLEEDLVL